MKKSWFFKLSLGFFVFLFLSAPAWAQEDTGIFPRAIITPKILEFPDTRVGTTAASMTVTISKTNSLKPLKIFRIFNHTPNLFPIVEDNCTNALLFNGETCEIKFAFSPNRERHYHSFYTVINSGINFVAFGGLKGEGVEPEMELSDDEIDFGDHPVGQPSSPHRVFVKNIGTGPLDVTSISSDNSVFTQSNNCIGTPVDPGSSCHIDVVFTPDAEMPFSGTITVEGDAFNSPLFLALTGTGVMPLQAALSVDKTALDFGNQVINTTSATQRVTATNSGDGPDLDITSVNVPAPFGLSNDNCGGATLAQDEFCTFDVDFMPTALGAVEEKLTFTVAQGIVTPTVDLSGTGIDVGPPEGQLSQDEVNFGDQTAETSSNTVEVTLTNIGGAPIIGGLSFLEGTNPEAFSMSNNCSEGVEIPVGGSCTIEVRFHPSQAGTFTAIVRLESNAANSPIILIITGIGLGPTVAGGGGCALSPSPAGFSASLWIGLSLLLLGGVLFKRLKNFS